MTDTYRRIIKSAATSKGGVMIGNCESPHSRKPLTSITRVVVFHHQPLVANGLAALLSLDDGIEVTAIASHAGRLVEAIARERPHVVVFGFAVSGYSRPDGLISRVWAASMGCRPAMVIIVPSDQDVVDALAVDALAVVTTDVAGHTLRELVRGAADSGSRRVPLELVRPVAAPSVRGRDAGRAVLTARESEVLCGIESGLSTKQIAASLGISVNTTRTHAQRLMSKLRVHSRLQAAALAADQPQLAVSGRRT